MGLELRLPSKLFQPHLYTYSWVAKDQLVAEQQEAITVEAQLALDITMKVQVVVQPTLEPVHS
jgi:hypothetical protein